MSKGELKIKNEKRVFDAYFKVDEAAIEEQKSNNIIATYNRCKLTRPDAVTVLIFNEDTNKVILVKQFRYPIIHHEKENILEAVAGKIDGDEDPKQAAIREVFEEIGYKISIEQLGNCIEIYASPGYSTEKIYIFLATVKNSDKIENAGGGLATEHENIEIIELDILDFLKMINSNQIKDSKTIISASLLKIKF